MTAVPTPPYPPGPGGLPPHRPRPSRWWFVVGGALLVAAAGTAVGLFWWVLSGFLATDATVRVDGEPHEVSVGTDGDRMLWVDESVVWPDCVVRDVETGAEIGLEPPGGEFRRDNGSVGDAVGHHRFDPGSGRLEVTCTGPDGGALPTYVEIGPAPSLAGFAGGILAAIVLPLLLGLAGFVVLVVTAVLWSTRPARPARPWPGSGPRPSA